MLLGPTRVGGLRRELDVSKIEGVVDVAGDNPEARMCSLKHREELLERSEGAHVELFGDIVVALSGGNERARDNADGLMQRRGP